MIDHKKYSEALSILSTAPDKIAAAQEKCKATLAEIRKKELSGNWSPNSLKAERERAIADRDRVCHSLAHSMRSALETVKANNGFADEPLNIHDPKIQNAINAISLLGKSLTFADQVSILEGFRGNPAGLRFIQSAFRKNGLNYAADQAGEMMKPVSQRAISQMEEVLNYHDYYETKNELNFPIERATWTKSEFGQQFDRMGYNSESKADPYSYALSEEMNGLKEREFDVLSETDPEKAAQTRAWISAQKLKVALAQRDVAEAKKTGKDPAEAFNRALSTAEKTSPRA